MDGRFQCVAQRTKWTDRRVARKGKRVWIKTDDEAMSREASQYISDIIAHARYAACRCRPSPRTWRISSAEALVGDSPRIFPSKADSRPIRQAEATAGEAFLSHAHRLTQKRPTAGGPPTHPALQRQHIWPTRDRRRADPRQAHTVNRTGHTRASRVKVKVSRATMQTCHEPLVAVRQCAIRSGPPGELAPRCDAQHQVLDKRVQDSRCLHWCNLTQHWR